MIDEGLTVATDVSLDDMETTSVVLPVRLQPFLPSPFRDTTKRSSGTVRAAEGQRHDLGDRVDRGIETVGNVV